MSKNSFALVQLITNIVYTIVSVILFLIAFAIIFWSVYQIIMDFISSKDAGSSWQLYKMMDEVALIVFSVAVADVARYLLIEEVLHGKDKKPLAERKKALTNLIMIITTAFSLEGLILTLQTAKSNLAMLLYPILLLIVSSLLLISLGLYQRYTASSTTKDVV